MPGFKLAFTLVAAAAIAVGNYFFGGKDSNDDDDDATRDSYYSSSSYSSHTFFSFFFFEIHFCVPRSIIPPAARHLYTNGGTYWNQIQKFFEPPQQSFGPLAPPSSYSHRPPATSGHSQTTHVARHLYTTNSGTSWNQTQQSYRPSQHGNDDDAILALEPDPYYLSSPHNNSTSRNQTQQPYRPPPPSSSYSHRPPATDTHSQTTARTPAPPEYCSQCGGYHPSVVSESPYTRTSSQTQPSTRTGTQASRSYSDDVHAHEPPEYGYSYTRTSSQTQPSTRTQASRLVFKSLYVHEPLSSTRTQASGLYSSLFKSVHAQELPEYGYSQTSSHLLSHVHAGSEPRLPTAPAVVSFDPRSDEPAGVEDLDFAKKLREQARRKGREMSDARSRVKSAQKKGSRGAAQEHTQRANAYQSAMNELDKRAAEIIFREKNKNRKEGMIDLHGLYVAEAIRLAKDQVQAARSRGDDVVRFIVGKGLHADDGEAKIRPALEGIFTKQGVMHSLDSKNAGVLVVRLD